MLDTGLSRPPSPTYTAITPVARAPERTRPAAETDLPAEETVRPATETDQSRQAADHERKRQFTSDRPEDQQVERRNIIDPESESFVYIATNVDTGQIVRQIPSETLLRLRAYTESIEAQKAQTQPTAVQETI